MNEWLLHTYKQVIDACHPDQLMPFWLKKYNSLFREKKHIRLIAAGKAASAMTAAVLSYGLPIERGLCITKKDHGLALNHPSVTLIEAGHPEPDENSFKAAAAVHNLVSAPGAFDGLLVLISGGASSLIADVPQGCTAEEISQTNRLLVNSGAGIHEINTIRKHLSSLKGGQLATLAWPVPVLSFILSDVPGDDIQTIGSGLTAPDDSSFNDALTIIEKYGLKHLLPESVVKHVKAGTAGIIPDTPGSEHPAFKESQHFIIGNNQLATETAAALAENAGIVVIHKSTNWQGDSNSAALKIANEINTYTGPLPACLIYGGETTLAVTGNGKGGRNQHIALRLLQELHRKNNPRFRFAVLCAGTDGTDGPTDAAGALIHSGILKDATFNAAELETALQTFNAYPLLEKWKALIKSGPTQTNVMDILIAVVY